MAYVIEAKNPFDPWDTERAIIPGGVATLRSYLEMKYPGFVEFPVPTICIVNGQSKLRSEWDQYVIEDRDIVGFVAVPGDPFTIIAIVIAVVVIALSVALALTMDVPKTPGELPASDPVFSNRGQTNAIRLGEPVEVCYGRNRIYPSLASRPFYKYSGNDQFQYSLFCIGQGEFEIHALQIGDTDINSFQEVDYELVPPGSVVTLFPTNVITSVEAGGQELFAPNQEEYVAPGWVGPFAANPSGTETTHIEVDIIYPQGLYRVDSKRGLQSLNIQIEVEARLIDDAGVPLSAFVPLTIPFPISFTAATTTPQRRTYSATVTAGRYEVRVRRIGTKDLSEKAGNSAIWEGLRGFVDTEQDFGNKTLLAIKIRATNNLNDRTANRFNTIATRKLPIYDFDTETWSPLTATRGIIWAFIDAFRNTVYGAKVPDAFFDYATLNTLNSLYELRGEHFDWIFRDKVTVWEVATAIARVGRGVPVIKGSEISLVRDGPLDIPVAMFTQDNIIRGTWSMQVKLWDLDETDSLAIEYTEPTTGYKQEIVTCTLPGGSTDNPKDIRLAGCQDRTHAYREGLFTFASMRYLRENISFDTGLEGHIPSFGDLISISYDVPRWGQGGYVVNAEQSTGGTAVIWLSEPLDWDRYTGEHVIQFRLRNGDIAGPYTALRMTSDQQVMVDLPTDTDFLLDGLTEPMLYQFGILGNIAKLAKVVGIEPKGNEIINIKAVTNAPQVHQFDELEPSALDEPALAPEAPDLPEISQLFLTQIDDLLHIIQIAWTPAFGAISYIVETSEDGSNWQQRAVTTQTSLQVQVRPGTLYVRVAALGNGQGEWIQDTISISLLTLEVDDEWTDDLTFGVKWWEVLNATGYLVKVYRNELGYPLPIRTETLASTARNYQYTYAMAVADGVVARHYKITVDPIFEEGATGTPGEIEFDDELPEAPLWGGYVFNFTDPGVSRHYIATFSVPHVDDIYRVKIWVSPISGFDPAVTIPYIDDQNSSIGWTPFGSSTDFDLEIEIDSTGGHPAHYVRIAIFDVWGNELDTNMTVEIPIAAFP